MRTNLEDSEQIVASLPQIWGTILGLAGFFHKSKEGILVLTTKNLIFVPRYLFITAKEKEKYFGDDKANVTQVLNYNESDLDEDLTQNPKSWIIDLNSIMDVSNVIIRKVNFLRVTFKENNKEKKYDFATSRTITNYPQRQPLLFYSLDWSSWITLIRSYLP